MMTFKKNNSHFEAINSIKTVIIMESAANRGWMVYTPNGRLMDEFTSAGPFVSFEAAKKNAEMNVGMVIHWVA